MKRAAFIFFFPFAALANNPFTYKEVEPVIIDPAAVQQQINPELSERQREMVERLILKAIEQQAQSEALKQFTEINGEKALVIKAHQRYIGVASGMHVLYDNDSMEYYYHDAKDYKKVIREKIQNATRNESIETLIGEIPTVKTNKNTLQLNNGIKPVELSQGK